MTGAHNPTITMFSVGGVSPKGHLWLLMDRSGQTKVPRPLQASGEGKEFLSSLASWMSSTETPSLGG